jgi:prepilin-type processing-associated H-X9-DG protein
MAGFGTPATLNHKQSNAYNFYSPHPSVCNFVFADGAVHALSFRTSLPVLRKLSTRDGGEVVSANDY